MNPRGLLQAIYERLSDADRLVGARLLRRSPLISRLWNGELSRAVLLVVVIFCVEIAAGLFLMERVTEMLEERRREEFSAAWQAYHAERLALHETQVRGYAWWGELSRAVRGGDRFFINLNVAEDASLTAEYDFIWLAGARSQTYFAALDGLEPEVVRGELKVLSDGGLAREYLDWSRAVVARAREVKPEHRVPMERPIVRHELRELAGRLRLLSVSPLCDNRGYPLTPGYFVFASRLDRMLEGAGAFIPAGLKMVREKPAGVYHYESMELAARAGQVYLVFEPHFLIAEVARPLFYVLILVQVLIVVVAGLLAVPYFARRRGRRLEREVADRTRMLEAARMAAERDRRELSQLTAIKRRIEASRDLDEMLDQVFEYFNLEYEIEAVIVLLVSSDGRELYSYRTTEPPRAAPEMIEYSRELRVPLETDGILQRTFARKRAFFLGKVDERTFPVGSEREIIDRLQLQSFLLVPLLVRDEPNAMILFTSYDRRLQLRRPDIDRITRFCNQVAGPIHNSSLLREVENERQRSEEARLQAEDSRQEIARLSDIARQLNATIDLNQVLEGIRSYFKERYQIDNVWLQLVDEKHGEIYTYRVLTDELDNEVVDFLYGLRQQLDASAGLVWLTYSRRRPIYIRRVAPPWRTEDDAVLADKLNLKSTLQIPLLIRETVTGILHVTSFMGHLTLTRRDIESITVFAQQIAGAVHTARLYEQAEISRLGTEVARINAERAQKKADSLLTNILPEKIAEELKEKGEVSPLEYESVTVLFTDFVGFTRISERWPPDELIRELDGCFTQFDDVSQRNNLEKLKTIGDAYMCAGGLPDLNNTHPVDACLAALEFQHFMDQMRDIKKSIGLEFWELRVGIHTGPLTAGVVGKKKFAYDIWGDTVNTASRMETHGAPGRVNISGATYEIVRYFFVCEHRGKVETKGKGLVDMYFVNGIHPRLSRDGEGLIPNDEFRALYNRIRNGARLRYKSELTEF